MKPASQETRQRPSFPSPLPGTAVQGMPGCARLREQINKTQSLEELERLLKDYAEGREKEIGEK